MGESCCSGSEQDGAGKEQTEVVWNAQRALQFVLLSKRLKYASLANNFVTDRIIIVSKIASTPVSTCILAKIQTLFTEF